MRIANTAKNDPLSSLSSAYDAVIESERIPISSAKNRKAHSVAEKNEYGKLASTLGNLGKSIDQLKSPKDFIKLNASSSHPDILEGMVSGLIKPGDYEFEVNSLAHKNVLAEAGFPDINSTSVGFGYLGIEDSLGNISDVEINPGSTLQDVAQQINKDVSGVKAQIINTGIGDDPFKLVISSEKTGELAKVVVDPDTTFLNFDEVKKAQNFAGSMEDISFSRATNQISDLVEGLKLNFKKSRKD